MEQAKPFAALDICGGTRRQIIPGPERRDVIEAVGVPIHRGRGTAGDANGSTTGPVDVLVIDRVERPSPN
jgi:hypothetical protein